MLSSDRWGAETKGPLQGLRIGVERRVAGGCHMAATCTRIAGGQAHLDPVTIMRFVICLRFRSRTGPLRTSRLASPHDPGDGDIRRLNVRLGQQDSLPRLDIINYNLAGLTRIPGGDFLSESPVLRASASMPSTTTAAPARLSTIPPLLTLADLNARALRRSPIPAWVCRDRPPVGKIDDARARSHVTTRITAHPDVRDPID